MTRRSHLASLSIRHRNSAPGRTFLPCAGVLFGLALVAMLAGSLRGQTGRLFQLQSHDRYVSGTLGFTGSLGQLDAYGSSCVELGDVDGDGHTDVAVGAPGSGTVWIMLLDAAGQVKNNGTSSIVVAGQQFGAALAPLGDLNKDGVPDVMVGAPGASQGGGAVYCVFLKKDGSQASRTTIASPVQTSGFGVCVRELDKSSTKMAVCAGGSSGNGEVVLFDVTSTGTVSGTPVVINTTSGALQGKVGLSERFGASAAFYDDLDGDSNAELLVGAPGGKGALWLLYLGSSGAVKTSPAPKRIDDTATNFGYSLTTGCGFGSSLNVVPDLDDDGFAEVLAGLPTWVVANDPADGMLFVMSFGLAGEVLNNLKIHHGTGGLPKSFGGFTSATPLPVTFGSSACTIADRDGNGYPELLVGAGGTNGARGEVYLLRLRPTRMQGVAVTPISSALLGKAGGAGLLVDNLGSSGMDGVRMHDFGDAHGFAMQGLLSPAGTVNSATEVRVYGTVDAQQNQLIETYTMTRTAANTLQLRSDWSPVGATTYAIQLWRNGQIVTIEDATNGTVIVQGTSTVRPTPIYMSINDYRFRPRHSIVFGGDVTASLKSQNYTCDEVRILPGDATKTSPSVSSVEVRGLGAGTGGSMTVELVWLELNDTLVRTEQTADMRVTGTPATIRIDQMSRTGGGGVVAAPAGFPVYLDLHRSPTPRTNAGATATSWAMVQGTEIEMVSLQLEALTGSDRITPTFPGHSVSVYDLEVWRAGVLVTRQSSVSGTFDVTPVGPIASPDFVFTANGGGLRYHAPQTVSVGSSNFVGDTIQCVASTSTQQVDRLTSLKARKKHCAGHVTILKAYGAAPVTDIHGVGEAVVPTYDFAFLAADNGQTGLELFRTNGRAGGLSLVKDINPGANGSNPSVLVSDGERVFFVANDGVHGDEPWVSDGSAAGTTMLADIATGQGGSSITEIVVRKDWRGTRLWFAATHPQSGRELWTSNGTAAGTRLVTDLVQGTGSSNPTVLGVRRNGDITVCLFAADDGRVGEELWVVDSKTLVASLVADIRTGQASSTPRPASLDRRSDSVLDSMAIFADDGRVGRELWWTDGKTAKLLADIQQGQASSNPTPGIRDVRGNLFFGADDGTHGAEVWVSDLTANGTRLLLDARTGSQGSKPRFLPGGHRVWPNPGYWAAHFALDDGVHGEELWGSDGTAAGTTMFRDLVPGPQGSAPESLTWIGGNRMFLRAKDAGGVSVNYDIDWIGVNQPPRPDCVYCEETRGGAWLCRWKNNEWWCHCMVKLKPAGSTLGIAPPGSTSDTVVMAGQSERGSVLFTHGMNGMSLPVGVSSFGMQQPPTLYADDGRLGRSVEFFGTAEPGSTATIYLSIPSKPLPFGFGRFLYINPIVLIPLANPTVGTTTGVYSTRYVFPNLANLIGVRAAFQTLAVDGQGNYAVSNGIHMVVGG